MTYPLEVMPKYGNGKHTNEDEEVLSLVVKIIDSNQSTKGIIYVVL